MQTAYRSVPRMLRMHSLRKLLQSKALLDPIGIRFALSPAPSSVRRAGIRCLSRRFGSSSWSAINRSDRSSDEELEGSPGTDDPGEARKVWTFYDPLEGNLVTRVAEEDGRAEGKLDEVDESTKTGKTVQNVPVARCRKVGADAGKEEKKRVFSSSVSNSSWVPTAKRKSGKTKVSWVCEDCGATTGQWWGTCQSCQAVNTIKPFTETSASGRPTAFEVSDAATRSWLPRGTGEAVPQSLVEVNKGMNQLEWRIPL